MASFKCFVLKSLREVQPMPLFSACVYHEGIDASGSVASRRGGQIMDFKREWLQIGQPMALHVAIDGNRTYA